jgi:hypothetical protein
VPDQSPAMRFLTRSQQLTRLQSHILSKMQGDVETERKTLPAEIQTTKDVDLLVAALRPALERSGERWADIPLMLQLFHARHVDNFQSFLEELLRLILRTQPNRLKRDDAVPTADVLSHSTMEGVLQTSIDQKVHGWGYKSIRDLAKAVVEFTGFKLFPNERDALLVERLYDDRNLFTHNYGIVNQRYLRKHPDCKTLEGQPLAFDLPEIKAAWEYLIKASADIETRATATFRLVLSA